MVSSPSFMWPQIIYLVNSRDFPQMEVQVYKSVLCKIHTILLSKTKMTSLVSRLRKLLCVLSQIPQRLRTVVNTVFSNFLSSWNGNCQARRPKLTWSSQTLFWFCWVLVCSLQCLYHTFQSKELVNSLSEQIGITWEVRDTASSVSPITPQAPER